MKAAEVKKAWPAHIRYATFVTRGEKRYLQIELHSAAHGYSFFIGEFKNWLKRHFPETRLTSGGGFTGTYRIN